jgi:hypothetical protein
VSPASSHEHSFSQEWITDEDNHWHECSCGEKSDIGEHEETVVNRKDATEFEDGYTGDTLCEICELALEEGVIIPATHEHDFSNDWITDEDEHWHECRCGEKDLIGKHTYHNGTCTVCQKVDFDYDSTNPGTGDSAAPVFWMILAPLSILSLSWLIHYGKKKNMI